MAELLALVKHDCPVCDQVLPALDAAGVRILSQSGAADTEAQAARLGLANVPELDVELALSERLDPEAVPALVLLDGADERGRVEGLHRERMLELAAQAGVPLDLAGLPELRPGCASLTRDPEVAARLAAGRALQLVVRNVGGGRPGVEDRAAHGQPGKLGLCFAERLDETAPWPGLAQDRGVAPGEPGVTVMALEAPRVIVDQLAREPEGLCASFALGLESVATPRLRLAFDAMLLVGPEHGRIFRQAGWTRAQVQQRLHELTHSPA